MTGRQGRKGTHDGASPGLPRRTIQSRPAPLSPQLPLGVPGWGRARGARRRGARSGAGDPPEPTGSGGAASPAPGPCPRSGQRSPRCPPWRAWSCGSTSRSTGSSGSASPPARSQTPAPGERRKAWVTGRAPQRGAQRCRPKGPLNRSPSHTDSSPEAPWRDPPHCCPRCRPSGAAGP